jgi:hypothetical protein
MNTDDVFFHTEIHGASVCILKNDEKKDIPENSLFEASIFAACYSSAWKKGWGHAKIFHVDPKQVSKTPKSGEYLSKGSFIITGEKKYLEKPNLVLGIGLEMILVYEGEKGDDKNENDGEESQYYPQIISAPRNAIEKITKCHVFVQPTKEKVKTSDLAKKIKGILTYKITEFDKKYNRWAKYISLDSIIRHLPSGGGIIKKI